MSRLQDDLLEVYNNLVELSEVVLGDTPCPVAVEFDQGMGCLSFKVPSRGIYLRALNNYIIRPDLVPVTWLLPRDFDALMSGLSRVIRSGKLLQERVCLSPGTAGFELFLADPRNLMKGAMSLGTFRFWSGEGPWFRWRVSRKYRGVLR